MTRAAAPSSGARTPAAPEHGRGGSRAPLRIVAFGGGTGLAALVRGLVARGPQVHVTAVVAVSDDGGSSGRLRRELGLPAVGDARACLAAMSGAWGRLLEHRFTRGTLRGHPLGNLLLAAAYERHGRFSEALDRVADIVGARGRVLPATDARPVLEVRMADGRVLRGESRLAHEPGPVRRLRLYPEVVPPAPGVLEAVREADLLLLGPGSLFSSVIAAALPAGVARAIAASGAPRLLVQNLTTQRGETDDMSVADHVRAVREHLGPRSVDAVLVHVWNGPPPVQGLVSDPRALAALGVREISARLATAHGRGRLHDPQRLASAVLRFARGGAPRLRHAGG